MSGNRNQVNVRLNDKMNEKLTEVSNSLNLSKSEIVRLSIEDNLEKFTKVRTQLPKEEREEIVEILGKINKNLNTIRGELGKSGGNLNQIAKRLNQGKSSSEDMKLLKEIHGELKKSAMYYRRYEGRFRKLWQSLV